MLQKTLMLQKTHNSNKMSDDEFYAKKDNPETEKDIDKTLKNREELDINFVKKILSEKSFDIEYKNENGENALFLASDHHYTDIVKLLISKAANVNALTNEHKTPLMNAACSGLKGIVEILYASGEGGIVICN